VSCPDVPTLIHVPNLFDKIVVPYSPFDAFVSSNFQRPSIDEWSMMVVMLLYIGGGLG